LSHEKKINGFVHIFILRTVLFTLIIGIGYLAYRSQLGSKTPISRPYTYTSQTETSQNSDMMEILYSPNSNVVQLWTCTSGTWTLESQLFYTIANGGVLDGKVNSSTGHVEIFVNGVKIHQKM